MNTFDALTTRRSSLTLSNRMWRSGVAVAAIGIAGCGQWVSPMDSSVADAITEATSRDVVVRHDARIDVLATDADALELADVTDATDTGDDTNVADVTDAAPRDASTCSPPAEPRPARSLQPSGRRCEQREHCARDSQPRSVESPMGATLLSLGHYVPSRRVTNAELEDRLGLPEGWIFQRTGIRERRYASPDEALSDLAVRAGEMALARADFDRMRIALLIVATSTPDHLLPPSAPLVAFRLGLAGAGAVDMAGACAGFLYALSFADAFVKAHKKPALVIAANVLSRRTNPTERASVILFADAAGAALIAPDDREEAGARGVHLTSDGAGYDLIKIRAGGSRMPFASSTSANDALLTLADGRAVFARATSMMAGASRKALADVGAKISDVAHWVPHQANSRIISATQAKLALPDGAVLSSIELYGNSSAATIPLTLSLASETRSFARGDLLLMSAAGAGLTGGAVVWGM